MCRFIFLRSPLGAQEKEVYNLKQKAPVEVSVGDRNRITQKKELESTNARWNEYLNERREEI
jgi:hypothetical protein